MRIGVGVFSITPTNDFFLIRKWAIKTVNMIPNVRTMKFVVRIAALPCTKNIDKMMFQAFSKLSALKKTQVILTQVNVSKARIS